MTEKVDHWDHVRGMLELETSDQARAIALAEWVATNSTNQKLTATAPELPFWGLCGQRAGVFVELAERAGLAARRVQFEHFAGANHSAVEVMWENAWHYLDVTYAGYFVHERTVLSWSEIVQNPEAAIAGMVVIGPTHDRWSDGSPVDNRARMAGNYTVENIASAKLAPRPGTRVGS